MSKLSQTKIAVLDEYENKAGEWSFCDFERSLEQAMGKRYGNYQTAKLTIIQADKVGSWPNVVSQYVLSNLKIMGNSPIELIPIANQLIEDMDINERKKYKQ